MLVKRFGVISDDDRSAYSVVLALFTSHQRSHRTEGKALPPAGCCSRCWSTWMIGHSYWRPGWARSSTGQSGMNGFQTWSVPAAGRTSAAATSSLGQSLYPAASVASTSSASCPSLSSNRPPSLPPPLDLFTTLSLPLIGMAFCLVLELQSGSSLFGRKIIICVC